ncbi:4Fe-4S binding protein [Rhizobium mesosinicum]|uniref:4Fe-4S binding protein n=1 Tax=Rhizobium mesosinicum TaxID=335017 RepID=A0ABS7GT09_9HYPH|nr:4Fe-4S binding protein [Rhizobium mesosinicum]MBW9052510.1 4Fe-4S binding protein [Rhizobium mesosinicum]
MTSSLRAAPALVATFGDVLLRHQAAIRRLQWAMVALYVVLLTVPLLLPLPTHTDYAWNNVVRFAQFVFWGVWWPFIILATALVGRFWCGILCPEGALSEFASQHGAGRAIPGWMKWSGWPVVSFVSTTVYGQLTSIYQYPKPAALLLGGSTFAAIVIGARYGKAKRVWCRFLCPVNGVFATVSKIAPLHFRVDPDSWRPGNQQQGRSSAVNCAPLIPIKTMQGAAACHMCGRCSGYRGAIRLSWRNPASDIVHGSGRLATMGETVLIVPVLLGLVPAALHWSDSGLFQMIRLWLVERCLDLHLIWPLSLRLPWWVLTDYPLENDVMTLVDAVALLILLSVSVVAATIVFGIPLAACVRILRMRERPLHHLTQALIPLAAACLFSGLLSLTVSQLRSDGVVIPCLDLFRGSLVLAAAAWSAVLVLRIGALYNGRLAARMGATFIMFLPIAAFSIIWIVAFLG